MLKNGSREGDLEREKEEMGKQNELSNYFNCSLDILKTITQQPPPRVHHMP